MKKVLFFSVALVLAIGLSWCTRAKAEWIPLAKTFHTGYYLMCNVSEEGMPYCLAFDAEGTAEERDAFVSAFNEDKLTPKHPVYFFFWDIDNWIKEEPPWQYKETK